MSVLSKLALFFVLIAAAFSNARALSPYDGSAVLQTDRIYLLSSPSAKTTYCGFVRNGWRAGLIIRRGARSGHFISFRAVASNYKRIAKQLTRRPRQARSALKKASAFLKDARRYDPACASPAPVIPTPTPTLPEIEMPPAICPLGPSDQAEDATQPTTIVGNGTADSCTSDAFVNAVANGGIITFNCGADPVTITLSRTAKVFNNKGPKIVIDGGNKVTLSGGGVRRILYQNTCDRNQVWTTSHCQNQDHPQLTVQNITFVDGNSKGSDPDGGGAIWVRGGLFKAVNTRFYRNGCDDVGPDVGGGGIRVFSMYNNTPVPIVGSVFGGTLGQGNVCSNGGALSSIGVSFRILNSHFSHNQAIGNGANPSRSGTPGGGSGGAIYNDGNEFHLSICGSAIADNAANEGGGAIFFVSNDRSGSLTIQDSTLRRNPSGRFETRNFPGIFVLARSSPVVINSTLE